MATFTVDGQTHTYEGLPALYETLDAALGDELFEEIIEQVTKTGYIPTPRKKWNEWRQVEGQMRQVALPTTARDADGEWVWGDETERAAGDDGILGTEDDTEERVAVSFTLGHSVSIVCRRFGQQLAEENRLGDAVYWSMVLGSVYSRRMKRLVGSPHQWSLSFVSKDVVLNMLERALLGEAAADFREKWSWNLHKVQAIAERTPGTPEYREKEGMRKSRRVWVLSRIKELMQVAGHGYPPEQRTAAVLMDFRKFRRAANEQWDTGSGSLEYVEGQVTMEMVEQIRSVY